MFGIGGQAPNLGGIGARGLELHVRPLAGVQRSVGRVRGLGVCGHGRVAEADGFAFAAAAGQAKYVPVGTAVSDPAGSYVGQRVPQPLGGVHSGARDCGAEPDQPFLAVPVALFLLTDLLGGPVGSA